MFFNYTKCYWHDYIEYWLARKEEFEFEIGNRGACVVVDTGVARGTKHSGFDKS